jgi:hypothetical protein
MHKHIRNIQILLFVLIGVHTGAQSDYFSVPVKIPVFLSANFCELRPNHFHGGIDIKTEQRTGIPIYSAAEGYISRIVVSPSGYGKALYIVHPNGKTSVYAHLDSFRSDIDTYVKQEQYRKMSFSADLFPDAETFRVERHELIAYSGNSGSSGGPHLHYEIRDTRTQDALNPLLFYPEIRDNIPPRIYGLTVFPLSENGHVNFSAGKKKYNTAFSGGTYSLVQNIEIPASGKIGLAVHANDFYDGSHNPCGIYSAHVKIDDQEIFYYQFDRMPFADTRYMNSHIDYEESLKSGKRIHRLYRQPGDKLQIYDKSPGEGTFYVRDGSFHRIEITLRDLAGNSAVLMFQIRGIHREISSTIPDGARFFTYDEDNYLANPWFEMFAPAGAFYDDFYFTYETSPPVPGLFSRIHRIHSETVPVHTAVRIRILAEDLPERLADKSFIVKTGENGSRSYVGGKLINGWFEADVRSLGNYSVMADTIPPVITPLSIKEKSTLTESNRIRFLMHDNLSGIKSYEGFINGEWVLFEYDAKYRLLQYSFDPARLTLGKRHQLVLKVTDNANNTAQYEASFWK